MHATAQRRNDAHPAFLQRKCGCGGTCGSCSDKRKKPLDRAAVDGSTHAEIPPIIHDVLRSPGQPLGAATRAHMESRFRHDFSGVRVHTDPRAADSASAVHARAYTVGNDIVFNRGMYQPQSAAGGHLLAHELTHVVQQAGGVQRSAHGISSPADATEQAADRAADVVMAGGTPSIATGGAGVVHRQPLPRPGYTEDYEGTFGFCKVDIFAAIRGDWDKAFNCCLKIPDLMKRKACIDDLIKVAGWRPGGRKSTPPGGGGTFPIPQRPPGPPIPPTTEPFEARKCFPPEEPTLFGGCCKPGQLFDRLTGSPCLFAEPKGPEKPPPQPPARPLPSPAEITFQFDRPALGGGTLKTSLTTTGKAAYDALVESLRGDTSLKVTLIGRASPKGTETYNEELGARRASLIADALVADGIAPTRIDDAPGGVASARQIRNGVVTTGERGASTEADRMVRVIFFR